MSHSELTCPKCQLNNYTKNGSTPDKKPKFKCKMCGKQFVENSTKKFISDTTKELIDKLLLEKISLAGIARATGVSGKWLQDYVNSKYSNVPRQVNVCPKKKVN